MRLKEGLLGIHEKRMPREKRARAGNYGEVQQDHSFGYPSCNKAMPVFKAGLGAISCVHACTCTPPCMCVVACTRLTCMCLQVYVCTYMHPWVRHQWNACSRCSSTAWQASSLQPAKYQQYLIDSAMLPRLTDPTCSLGPGCHKHTMIQSLQRIADPRFFGRLSPRSKGQGLNAATHGRFHDGLEHHRVAR